MNLKTIVAVVLIVLGVAAFAYQVLTYAALGPDANTGSMHMSTGDEHLLPLAAIFGAAALIGGVALLLLDKSDLKPTAMP